MFVEIFKNLTLSFRELRGSFNEFKIVVASIFLGVFIITAVGSISENLKSEIKNKRVEMLGGNFELSTTYQEFPNNIKSWLEKNGKTTHLIESKIYSVKKVDFLLFLYFQQLSIYLDLNSVLHQDFFLLLLYFL